MLQQWDNLPVPTSLSKRQVVEKMLKIKLVRLGENIPEKNSQFCCYVHVVRVQTNLFPHFFRP
jgi:hypothetical protein